MNKGFLGVPSPFGPVVAGPWGNSNLSLDVVANGTQLIIRARARDGSHLGSSPAQVAFPNVDQSIGDYKLTTLRQRIEPLIIPSGGTMGFTSGVSGRLWVVLFDDISGPALGVINCLSGTSVTPLGANIIGSASAFAGGANSAQVIYSNNAIVSRPYIILGYLTWETALVTAGTWLTKPDRIKLAGYGVKLPGDGQQSAGNGTGAVLTGTTAIPYDDTIPQATEGDPYLTQAIIITSAANVLRMNAGIFLANSSGGAHAVAALVQDAVANAIASAIILVPTNGQTGLGRIDWSQLAGANGIVAGASTTITLRAGGTSGTTTVNGSASARKLGGSASTFLRVEEIVA
jgi:hypothetical protein